MTTTHGFRVKTRKLMTKEGHSGFTKNILDIYEAKQGDKVVIILDPSIHKGMPHKRYHGKVGTITGRKGRSIELTTDKQGKEVKLIVSPYHLKRIQE